MTGQRVAEGSSAAVTLDVHADLFDSVLTTVADKLDEAVQHIWAKTSQSSRQAARKSHLPAPTGTEHLSLLSGLN